jgi:hypothetical protein
MRAYDYFGVGAAGQNANQIRQFFSKNRLLGQIAICAASLVEDGL